MLPSEVSAGPMSRIPIRRPRRLWQSVHRFLRAAVGLFPFTIAGLLVLALSGLAFWVQGLLKADLVLLAAGLIGALLTVLMALYASLVSLVVRFRRRSTGTRPGLLLECEIPCPTGFRSPWQSWLPFLEIRWSWEEPRDVEVVAASPSSGKFEVVLPRKRGVYHRVIRKLAVRDGLGLAAVSWRKEEPLEITILPHRGALDRMPLLESLAGGEDLSDPRGELSGDRVDMRQYARGDSPRLILWKNYARTRKLLVRIPERAFTAKPRSCAYLVAGRGDEAGAGLVRCILEQGFLGDNWRFGADGSAGYACNPGDALGFIARSGNAPPEQGTGFPEFLAQAEKDGYSACFVILPPVTGPWVEPVLAAIRRSRIRLHLYTAMDGVPKSLIDEPRWRRILFKPQDGSTGSLDDLELVAMRFKAAGCPFLLADRSAGTIRGDIRALLEKRLPKEKVRA
jgi:hypothetical protein